MYMHHVHVCTHISYMYTYTYIYIYIVQGKNESRNTSIEVYVIMSTWMGYKIPRECIYWYTPHIGILFYDFVKLLSN